MRIVAERKEHAERSPVLPRWQEFIDNAERLRLTVPKADKSVEKKLDWFEKQVAPTFAGLVRYFDGDMSFVYNNMQKNYNRLSQEDRRLFENNADSQS